MRGNEANDILMLAMKVISTCIVLAIILSFTAIGNEFKETFYNQMSYRDNKDEDTIFQSYYDRNISGADLADILEEYGDEYPVLIVYGTSANSTTYSRISDYDALCEFDANGNLNRKAIYYNYNCKFVCSADGKSVLAILAFIDTIDNPSSLAPSFVTLLGSKGDYGISSYSYSIK